MSDSLSGSREPKWNASVVNSRLRKVVSPVLKPLGFRWDKYNFVRETAESTQEVFAMVSSSSWYEHRIGLTVRVHLHPVMSVGDAYSRPGRTGWIGKLSHHEEFRDDHFDWGPRSFDELELALPDFVSVLKDRGLRFLELAGTIAGVDEYLNNSNDSTYFRWIDPPIHRLIVASLNGNPRVDEIVEEVLVEERQLFDASLYPKEYHVNLSNRPRFWRDCEPLLLLVDDLRAGVLRDFVRDGFGHPGLVSSVEWEASPTAPPGWLPVGFVRPVPEYLGEAAEFFARRANEPGGESVPVAEVVETVELRGFDRDGEPSVRVFGDGHLEVVFEFMPPSAWEMTAEDEARFGDELSAAIGVDVVGGEDAEFFVVNDPRADTIDKIRAFVSSYRKTHGYTKR